MCRLSQQHAPKTGAVEQVLPVQPLEEAPTNQRLARHRHKTLPRHRPRHPRAGLPSILRGLAV